MLLFLSLLFFTFCSCKQPQTVAVCGSNWPGCKYTGILGLKNALSLESTGTTINVYEGTYYGGLVMKIFNIIGTCGLYPGSLLRENTTKLDSSKKKLPQPIPFLNLLSVSQLF